MPQTSRSMLLALSSRGSPTFHFSHYRYVFVLAVLGISMSSLYDPLLLQTYTFICYIFFFVAGRPSRAGLTFHFSHYHFPYLPSPWPRFIPCYYRFIPSYALFPVLPSRRGSLSILHGLSIQRSIALRTSLPSSVIPPGLFTLWYVHCY